MVGSVELSRRDLWVTDPSLFSPTVDFFHSRLHKYGIFSPAQSDLCLATALSPSSSGSSFDPLESRFFFCSDMHYEPRNWAYSLI